MVEGETPLAALWPLIHTWTMCASVLDGDHLQFCQKACGELGLIGAAFDERVQGLDQYLDEIDILLEEIAKENGIEV